ncbi:MAG: GNAT family N-acetyltransferase [Chloroflexota bacterium]|nr:GNAT family N-acetyltransferase [Chloroflexota bacterium]
MPLPDDAAIRDLQPDDVAPTIDVLADSFLDFPALQVMTGTDAGARDRMARVFAMEFEPESKTSAIVAEVDGRVVGALTYADSPGCSAMSAGRMVRFARIAGTRIFRAMRVFSRIERAHPRTPHRHLPTVGVDPALQGRGIGRLLMEEFDRRCDADRIGAYLETIRWSDAAKPSHERFYGRLGYTVADVIPMTDEWSVLTMTRPPHLI